MSVVIADSVSCRLTEIPRGGLVCGHRVGVPPALAADACLLTLRTPDSDIRTAVQAVPLAEVPPGFIAVGDDLAAEWDADLATAQWELRRVDSVPASRLVLELPTEREPSDAAKDITNAGLAGELVWVPDDGADITIDVGDLPYRVRDLDVAGRSGVVARLTSDTRVAVYAPAVRAGVDMVILADCSGSMGVDDIPVGAEGWNSGRWMLRSEALKQALRELLDIRLQVSGRISRVALVGFDLKTNQRFPREAGMAQLDGGCPVGVIEQFRSAVALLRAENGAGTDIGNGLHEAANLLYQHGREGNEKLIVLVSDGADWAPKGEQASGELVHTVEEPVSLMAHLHRDMGIRLHAIGISTADMFRRRGYPQTLNLVPNHALLEELVKVGGGDPTTIGGLDVLADYFSGLGSGITHRVPGGLKRPPAPGPLPQESRTALARIQGQTPRDAGQAALALELCQAIMERAGECNTEADRALGGTVLDASEIMSALQPKSVPSKPEAVAGFLGKAVSPLRPDAPPNRDAALTGPAGPLRQLLNKIAAAARARADIGQAYRAEFQATDGSGPAILLDALTRVRDELAALRDALRRLPDDLPQVDVAGSAAEDQDDALASDWAYKE
jgi:hypothetical protein